MTLGDELRAVLNQEADVQITSGPDVESLIMGGRVRRRRRNLTRAGAAALAVVLVGGGASAVSQDRNAVRGSGIADQATQTSETSGVAAPPALAADPGDGDLEPGTYRIVAVSVGAGPEIEADLTFEGEGWRSGDYPVLRDATGFGGVGVYRPYALGAGTGCVDDESNADVGESPQALAQQLAELPRSTVIQPITPSEMLGRDALHLRLRIQSDCGWDVYYRVADTPRGSRGITYNKPGMPFPTVVIDFWVLDYDGLAVVVDSWHQVGASGDMLDRIATARDSITFVPGP